MGRDLAKTVVALMVCTVVVLAGAGQGIGAGYPVVDTGQDMCYDNSRRIPCPGEGESFDGQDGQYHNNAPHYVDHGDGTVSDRITGLMWQKSPMPEKLSYRAAKSAAADLRLAGYSDWRLPTIKELYSLIDFRGSTGRIEADSISYINTDYFDFSYGDPARGERLIDAQYWSATEYTGTTMHNNPTAFGVNFADGRIKGYPLFTRQGNGRDRRFVRYVRANPEYGRNDFVDNGDGTITDRATGLIWMQTDSGRTMNWHEALAYGEHATFAGYDDWRLPNAKELHSIVDYTKSPAAVDPVNRGSSIDPLFQLTEAESWFWTSTTHLEHGRASAAVYIAFGRAWGFMGQGAGKRRMDVHGAGAQRSDPKAGNPRHYATGRGPQGDEVRILNYVRLVRGGGVIKRNKTAAKSTSGYPYTVNRASSFAGDPYGMGRNRMDASPPPQGRIGRGQAGGQPGFGVPARFVERLDRDGDGRVSRTEFDGPAAHFDVLDVDRSGYLSEAERPQGPPPLGRYQQP